eukprot:c22808_g1_i3 orf=172-834(+)
MAQAPSFHVTAFIACVFFTLLLPSLISADDLSVELCLPCLSVLTSIEKALHISLLECEVDWVTPTGQVVSVDTEGCFKVKSSSKGDKGLSIKCSLEISILTVGTTHASLHQTLSFEPNASSGIYVADRDSDKLLELYLKGAIEKGAIKGGQIIGGTFNKAKRAFEKGAKKVEKGAKRGVDKGAKEVEKGAKEVEKGAKKGAQFVEGTFNKAKNLFKKLHP